MNKFKAAIFDMDGILIDSMLYWIEADIEFLKTHGIELTDDMIKYFSGRSERENMCWLKKEFSLSHEIEHLLETRRQVTDKIYSHHTNLMPGVENLISNIKKSGTKLAIASGAPMRQIQLAVNRFGWDKCFDKIVSPDHVDNIGKPDPAIYLHAAKLLGIEPNKCIVFEDAENGVVAAKRAGMYCVAIPDKRWSPGDFSQADLIAQSLEDERIYKLLDILSI
ncbi:MAG: HAD family phosphatase [Candidatus Magasanikbacteria bacterium]